MENANPVNLIPEKRETKPSCPMPIDMDKEGDGKVTLAIMYRLCMSWNCPRNYCQQYLKDRWQERVTDLFLEDGATGKVTVFDGPVEEWEALKKWLNRRGAEFVRLNYGETNKIYARMSLLSVIYQDTITDSRDIHAQKPASLEVTRSRKRTTTNQTVYADEAIKNFWHDLTNLPIDKKRISTSRKWKACPQEKKGWHRTQVKFTANREQTKKKLEVWASPFKLTVNDNFDAIYVDIPIEHWTNKIWKASFLEHISKAEVN